eukprot:jgi/Mesen1/7682/ME000403S06864
MAIDAGPMEKGSGSVDKKTVFVRNLAFTTTDAKLEEAFSEIGPVRQCFTVKQKGSEQLHRGFGFVQFAVVEDAERAVAALQGSLLGGRKLKLEIAQKRAPLDERRPRKFPAGTTIGPDGEAVPVSNGVAAASAEQDAGESEDVPAATAAAAAAQDAREVKPEEGKKKKKKRPLAAAQQQQQEGEGEGEGDGAASGSKRHKAGGRDGGKKTNDPKQPQVAGKASDKQRPARTVVVGGLPEAAPQQAQVLATARAVGPTECVVDPYPAQHLAQQGLSRDGCSAPAVAVVYESVTSAMRAVAALHGLAVAGATLWARQLGGEGAKLKKHRLIVRNLPFQITEAALRELLAPAGFIWELTLPRSPDGRSRGFAFVGYTCQAHAQKAVKNMNGKVVGGRPVAVDWAVAKKDYDAASAAAPPPGPAAPAATTGAEGEGDSSVGDDDDDDEDDDYEARTMPAARVPATEHVPAGKQGERAVKAKKGVPVGVAEEVELMRRVLAHVVSRQPGPEEPPAGNGASSLDAGEVDDVELPQAAAGKGGATGKTKAEKRKEKKEKKKMAKKDKQQKEGPEGVEAQETAAAALPPPAAAGAGGAVKEVKDAATEPQGARGSEHPGPAAEAAALEEKAKREVFVRNLAPDVRVQQVRDTLGAFGAIATCRLVLHPVTKRPKGTAFVEFTDSAAAAAAVAAAQAAAPSAGRGVVVGSRQVALSLAVGKEEARKLAAEQGTKERERDKRSLYLAQEGAIKQGSAAAQGMSKGDQARRQRLEREKETKLRSPMFAVSRTRLAVHNVPKDMGERALKELFLAAVRQRATKQHPVIKQVKVLVDDTKKGPEGQAGRSRGAAFVEFTEHQHALVALRALNNNPATFGAEHRPIVEFAIENQSILHKRKVQIANSKGKKPAPPHHKRPGPQAEGGDDDGALPEGGGGGGRQPKGPRHGEEQQAHGVGDKRRRQQDGIEKGAGRNKVPRKDGTERNDKGAPLQRGAQLQEVASGKKRGPLPPPAGGKSRADKEKKVPFFRRLLEILG